MFEPISMKLTERVEHIENMCNSYDGSPRISDILIRTGIAVLDKEINGIPSGQVALIA